MSEIVVRVPAALRAFTAGEHELRTAAGTVPYDPHLPLEAVTEARRVELTFGGRLHNADLRLSLGRRWRQLLVASGHPGLVTDFQTQ